MQPDPISRSLLSSNSSSDDAYNEELRLRVIEKFRSEYGASLTPQQVMQTVIWANDLKQDQLIAYLGPSAPDKALFEAQSPSAQNSLAGLNIPAPSFMQQSTQNVGYTTTKTETHKDHLSAFAGMFREEDPTKQPNATALTPQASQIPFQSLGETDTQQSFQPVSVMISPNGQTYGPLEKKHDKTIHLEHGQKPSKPYTDPKENNSEKVEELEHTASRLAQEELGQMPKEQEPTVEESKQKGTSTNDSSEFSLKIDHSHDPKKSKIARTSLSSGELKKNLTQTLATGTNARTPKEKDENNNRGGVAYSNNNQEALVLTQVTPRQRESNDVTFLKIDHSNN